MLTPAFSTVACPDRTLRQVAQRAAALGFEAVELRTFGDASTNFACDPALTSDEKVRTIFRERGVEPICIATGIRFDEPIWPPVLGLFSPNAERSIREGKRAVDLAVGIECPLVRVFGFEFPTREERPAALRRITERLRAVVDHADKSGVRIVVENGGSFSTSEELNELLDAIRSPLLGACYCVATGVRVGEDPARAIQNLGDRLWLARVKDVRDGRPCFLGEGEVPCQDFVRALIGASFNGPLVFEWDRAWVPGLAPAEDALAHASLTMYNWLGGRPQAAPAQNGAAHATHRHPAPARARH